MTGNPTRTTNSAPLAALVAVACLTAAPYAYPQQTDSGSTSTMPAASENDDAQDVKQEWHDAIETLKDYSANQRDQAVSAAKKLLATIDERIDRLERRSEDQWSQLSQDARQQRETTLRALRREREDLSEWYGGMKHSSTDAWETVKQGFVKAYDTLSNSFSRASDEFDSENSDSAKKP